MAKPGRHVALAYIGDGAQLMSELSNELDVPSNCVTTGEHAY